MPFRLSSLLHFYNRNVRLLHQVSSGASKHPHCPIKITLNFLGGFLIAASICQPGPQSSSLSCQEIKKKEVKQLVGELFVHHSLEVKKQGEIFPSLSQLNTCNRVF